MLLFWSAWGKEVKAHHHSAGIILFETLPEAYTYWKLHGLLSTSKDATLMVSWNTYFLLLLHVLRKLYPSILIIYSGHKLKINLEPCQFYVKTSGYSLWWNNALTIDLSEISNRHIHHITLLVSLEFVNYLSNEFNVSLQGDIEARLFICTAVSTFSSAH